MKNKLKWILPLTSIAVVSASLPHIASCSTNETDIPKNIELTYGQGLKDDIEIEHDETLTFACSVFPKKAPQDFIITSSNRLVADFNGNELKPNPMNNSGGTTEIVAQCKEYPGIKSNVIKVTVKPKPTTLTIDYSGVDFNKTMTIGLTLSSYKFESFDADFIFSADGYTGDHTVTPHAQWIDGSGLEPLSANIVGEYSDDNHTNFNVEISCPFTQWEIDKEYYYSLYFVIDEGKAGEKTIDVEKNLCFVNHNAQMPTVVEPSQPILVPGDYGASVTIKGCSANFRIGSAFGNILQIDTLNFISGEHFFNSPTITNLKNTSTGATFDVKIECDGINLSEKIVFHFDYILNDLKLKQSQDYTIEAASFIECPSYEENFELDDFDTPSATMDGFTANFEFDNAPSSVYPVVTASCESRDLTIPSPSASIIDVAKGTGSTTFSVKINFDNPITEPMLDKRFNLRFKIDGKQLVSSVTTYLVCTPPTFQYYGDGGQQQILYGKYLKPNETTETGYFTNIGIFGGTDIQSEQVTAEFEWNTSNALPTPTNIYANNIDRDLAKAEEKIYLTLVWPDAFTPDSSTFKLKIYVDDELSLTLDDLSLTASLSTDNFWDIESTFVGSAGTATVSTNTQDKFILNLSGFDSNKDLWGIEFSSGNCILPISSSASINAQHNQIIVEPNKYCHFIPGLKVKATLTYVSPSDIIPINQIEEDELLGPIYATNEVDWIAGKTYYLRADFLNSPFIFDYPLSNHIGFIGEFSEFGMKKMADCKIYNNFISTEYALNMDGSSACAFCAWANSVTSLKNNIMDFTIKVDTNYGHQKFKITSPI